MKSALITGIAGQDGSYLAEFLLDLGYAVHGVVRRECALNNLQAVINHPNLHLHSGDITDPLSVDVAMRKAHPDEIYNFAAQVFVPTSWNEPNKTFKVNVGGLLNVLNAALAICPNARIYQASSSEIFGNVPGPCNEQSEMRPESPYGVSKLTSHHLCRVYRNKGLYVVSGICYNHESPRRGLEMVTRKIAYAVAQWYHELETPLKLGNLEARRDWGYAKEYVEVMNLMLQASTPQDYVLGTGMSYSVREFLETAIVVANLEWENVSHLIQIDETFKRPTEVHLLTADATKVKSELGWVRRTTFHELVKTMVDAEICRSRQAMKA